MKVTLLVSPRNPAPASRSELRTMKSKFFLGELGFGVGLFVVGFEREAHQQAAAFACAQFGGDVARTAQGDAHFAAAFFDFRLRNGIGRVVRDGRAHDGSVGSVESRGGGVVHFGGRKYVRALHSGGRRQAVRLTSVTSAPRAANAPAMA